TPERDRPAASKPSPLRSRGPADRVRGHQAPLHPPLVARIARLGPVSRARHFPPLAAGRPMSTSSPTPESPPKEPAVTRPAPPPPAHSGLQHLRATALFLVLALLVSGVAYPVVVTGIAELVDPAIANGSLLRDPNGTVVGSSLIAQNTSAPYLFWERPSLTDYNTTLGTDTPPGPSDPALGALLNETIAYMDQAWNFSANHTLPDWLVTPSGSDLDP